MNIRTGMGKVQIKYDNGYTLSIINGFGSHTENADAYGKYWKIMENRDITASWTSEDIEIAVISPANEFVTMEFIKEAKDLVVTVSIRRLIEIMNELMVKEKNQC